MFENIMNFFKKLNRKEEKTSNNSKDAAKERLHLVLMQDRANVSADFLELMKQEIIDVIKKYIDVDENAIDVRLTNKDNGDGTNGAPALYANIPILNIKNEARKFEAKEEENKEEQKQNEDINKDINKEQEKDNKDDKEVKQEENMPVDIETKSEEQNENIEDKEVKAEEDSKSTENENDNKEETKETIKSEN